MIQRIQDMPEGSVVTGKVDSFTFVVETSMVILRVWIEEVYGTIEEEITTAEAPGRWVSSLLAVLEGDRLCRFILDRDETDPFLGAMAVGHWTKDQWWGFDVSTGVPSSSPVVQTQLAYINSKRALFGQSPLDPVKAGWGPEDIDTEARRLHWKEP